ncbi:hypothetical protein [Allocoleopsis sp.]|uniref:hypothetical protein n=1 Tax=Allocoleopsis sp. TaxID=3088169 RepID=UPI002FD70EAF
MRRTAIVLALTAVLSLYGQRTDAADFEQLLSGSLAPLNVKLKDLDSSWRQISISGQFEMGDLLQTYSNLFGGKGNSGVYYTQGKTVTFGGETYVIAYRLVSTSQGVSFRSLIESTLGGGSKPSEIDRLTPETSLTLSLLNLRTIGSLNNIRPFNLKEELAASEQAYQYAIASYEKAQLETLNSQVSDNLTTLGSALLKYAEEHNGVLPQLNNSATVESALKEWVEDQSAFVHPNTSEPYQFNSSLSGKKLAEIPNPEQLVAFYEATSAKDGSRGVVFLDGRTERISSAQWSKVKQVSDLP